MSIAPPPWDKDLVRNWLERRAAAARLDQAAADRQGYEAQGDYDDAAAEEWVCSALLTGADLTDPAALAAHIKMLIGQEEFRVTGINDDRRFERSVRAQLRKIAKMTKTNDGWTKTLRYQR